MRFSFSLILVAAHLIAAAQESFTVSGRVVDAKTKAPIAYVSVYLANTALGSATSEDGYYKITGIPPGKYDLVASFLGYGNYSGAVLITEDVSLNIELREKATQLKEIIVRPDRSVFKKYYATFKDNFLGITPNSRRCEIINQDVIDMEFDDETKKLKAVADGPIEIVNRALGYKIYYELEEFEIDFKKATLRVFGIPRFAELDAKSGAQKKRWIRNRDQAYKGSLIHFMKSLLYRSLKENDFDIYKSTAGNEVLVHENSIFTKKENQANIKGEFDVVYGEREDFAYSRTSRYSLQRSTITFNADSIIIYKNGYFENYKSIVVKGYLGWRECVGNLVPLGYQLSKD